jgi:hypothetical protein
VREEEDLLMAFAIKHCPFTQTLTHRSMNIEREEAVLVVLQSHEQGS